MLEGMVGLWIVAATILATVAKFWHTSREGFVSMCSCNVQINGLVPNTVAIDRLRLWRLCTAVRHAM